MSALLARPDVEILTARSGSEALELLLVHEVALALLDVQMPDMDGFELAELMRGSERTRHIPLIFVTAGAREQHRQFKGYELRRGRFHLQAHRAAHSQEQGRCVLRVVSAAPSTCRSNCSDRTETLRLNEMFSALLAHDLRSPLSAMLASARLLQRRDRDKAALEAAARIVSSGNRMARMIEDMLDLARARLGGGIVVKREPADFRALVERALREHQAAAPERTIESTLRGDFAGRWDPGAHRAGGVQPDRQRSEARHPRRANAREPGRQRTAIT